jgi:hypothetical protein
VSVSVFGFGGGREGAGRGKGREGKGRGGAGRGRGGAQGPADLLILEVVADALEDFAVGDEAERSEDDAKREVLLDVRDLHRCSNVRPQWHPCSCCPMRALRPLRATCTNAVAHHRVARVAP